jgi:hypothetical protein
MRSPPERCRHLRSSESAQCNRLIDGGKLSRARKPISSYAGRFLASGGSARNEISGSYSASRSVVRVIAERIRQALCQAPPGFGGSRCTHLLAIGCGGKGAVGRLKFSKSSFAAARSRVRARSRQPRVIPRIGMTSRDPRTVTSNAWVLDTTRSGAAIRSILRSPKKRLSS